MSFVTRKIQVNWTWAGNTTYLSGYEVAISKAATSGPDDGFVVFGRSGKTAAAHVFESVTVEIGVSYKAWVRAVYGEKTSAWVATGTTFTPDESWESGISIDLINETGFSKMEGGETAFIVGTHTNTVAANQVVTLVDGQNTGNWESPEFSLENVTDITTSDVRWQIERDDYFHNYLMPTTSDGFKNNSQTTYDNIDTDIYFQKLDRVFTMDTYESGNEGNIVLEAADDTNIYESRDLETVARALTAKPALNDIRVCYHNSFEGSGAFKYGSNVYFPFGYISGALSDILVYTLGGTYVKSISTSVGTRYGCVGGWWNGELYLFGGYRSGAINELVKFNPNTEVSTLITTDTGTPSARYYCQGGIFGDYLYVYGGYNPSATCSQFYRRNMNTGVWETLTSGSDNAAIGACWIYNNKLHFLYSSKLMTYNTTNSTWETTLTMVKVGGIANFGYVVTDANSIVLFGGYTTTTIDDCYELFFDDLTINKLGDFSTIGNRHNSNCWYDSGLVYIGGGYSGVSNQSTLHTYGPFRTNKKFMIHTPIAGNYDLSVYRTGQLRSSYNPKVQFKAAWESATGAEYLLNSFYVKKKDGTIVGGGTNGTNLLANGTATDVQLDGSDLSNHYPTIYNTFYFPVAASLTLNTTEDNVVTTDDTGFWWYAKFYVDGSTYKGGTICSGTEGSWSSTAADGYRLYARYDPGSSINTVSFDFDDLNTTSGRSFTVTGRLVSGWNEVIYAYRYSPFLHKLTINGYSTDYTTYDLEALTITDFRLWHDGNGTKEAFSGLYRCLIYDKTYSGVPASGQTSCPSSSSKDLFLANTGLSSFTGIDLITSSYGTRSLTITSASISTRAYSADNPDTDIYTNGTWESNVITLDYSEIDSAYLYGSVSNATYVKLYKRTSEDGTNWTAYSAISNQTASLAFPTFYTYKWGFWAANFVNMQDYFLASAYSIETNIHNGTSWIGWKSASQKAPIIDVNTLSLANIANCKYKYRVSFNRARFGGAIKLIYIASKIGEVKAFASESGATNDSLWRSAGDYTKLDGGVIYAGSRIVVGDNNIILDGKSNDGEDNAIYVADDGGPGGSTGFGGEPRDYVKLHKGNIEFYIAAEGMHRRYNSLSKCIMGLCNSGEWKVISDESGPVFWKKKPSVFVYPNSTLIYDATNSMQSQTFQCYVEAVEKVAEDSMQWKFKPKMQLSLGAGMNGINVGLVTLAQSGTTVYSNEVVVNGQTKSLQINCSAVGTYSFTGQTRLDRNATWDSYCSSSRYWYDREQYGSSATATPSIGYNTVEGPSELTGVGYCVQYQVEGSSTWVTAPSLNFTSATNITKFRLKIYGYFIIDYYCDANSGLDNVVIGQPYNYANNGIGVKIDYFSGDFTEGDVDTPGTLNYIAIGE